MIGSSGYKETPDPEVPDHVSAEIIGRVRINPNLLFNLCHNIVSGTKQMNSLNELGENPNEATKSE